MNNMMLKMYILQEDQFQFTKNEIVENMKNISSEDSEYSKLTTNDDLMKPKKEYHFQKKVHIFKIFNSIKQFYFLSCFYFN